MDVKRNCEKRTFNGSANCYGFLKAVFKANLQDLLIHYITNNIGF